MLSLEGLGGGGGVKVQYSSSGFIMKLMLEPKIRFSDEHYVFSIEMQVILSRLRYPL